MKVVYLTNLPSPYRVDFFNELGKYCELTVLFERKRANDRNEKWYGTDNLTFISHYLKSKEIGAESSFSLEQLKYFNKENLIVIGGYSSITAMISIVYLKFKGIPFILNADGAFINYNENKLASLIKRFFISKASYWVCTSNSAIDYFCYYGANKEKIFKYPFSSIRQRDIVKEPIDKSKKVALRKELNIPYDKVILSVGQIINRKGMDLLIKNAYNIPGVGIYIVGGNPSADLLKMMQDYHITNVHFVGFMNYKELVRYYQSADVFVLLTRYDVWGLVINEALANGLPVISTSFCGAALELLNNKNGLIIDNIDNCQYIHQAISSFLEKVEKDDSYQKESLRAISNYTIENMARKHFEIFQTIKKDCNCFKEN